MRSSTIRSLVVLALLVPLPVFAQTQPQSRPTASSDAPSPAEQVRIEAVLRERGFVRWKEIEREDDGRTWEIDDAYTADGRRFDLRLSADDLREIARHAED